MGKRTNQKPEAATATALATLPTDTKPNLLAVQMVAIDAILIRGKKDRGDTDPAIPELAASMAVVGLMQPITVKSRSALQLEGEKELPAGRDYLLVAGERRLWAAKLLGWKEIAASVIGKGQDADLQRAVENVHRLDLNPVQTAIAVGEVLDDEAEALRAEMGMKADAELAADAADAFRQQTIKRAAAKLGKSETWVRDNAFLATLDATTRELVVAGRLPWAHARELAKVIDPEVRAGLAEDAASDPKHGVEYGLTFKELAGRVAAHLRSLAEAPWRLDVEFAGGPACQTCPSNSKNQTGLFEHHKPQTEGRWGKTHPEPQNGVCLNAACYGRKSGAYSRQVTSAVRRATLTVSAVSKAVKGKGEPEKPINLAKAEPAPFVRPEKFKRDVTAKVKAKADAAKSPSREAPAKRAQTPEQIAKQKFEEELGDWQRKAFNAADEAIEDPFKLACLRLVEETKLFAACRVHTWENKRPKPADVKELTDLITVVMNQDWKVSFPLIMKYLSEGKGMHLSDWEWTSLDAGAIEPLLTASNAKLPAKPKLEDFLPKDKAAPVAAKKPGKKKAGGK